MLGHTTEKTNEQTAQNVDRQRAIGKANGGGYILRAHPDEIAQCRTYKTAAIH